VPPTPRKHKEVEFNVRSGGHRTRLEIVVERIRWQIDREALLVSD